MLFLEKGGEMDGAREYRTSLDRGRCAICRAGHLLDAADALLIAVDTHTIPRGSNSMPPQPPDSHQNGVNEG